MQIPRPPPRPILSLVVGPSGSELAQAPALTRVPSPTVFCQEPVPCTVRAYRLPCSVHSEPALITEICHSWPEWVRVHRVSCHDVRRTHRGMTEFFVFAQVLSRFLPEAPSGFITHYPSPAKESKFSRLMLKRAEFQNFLAIIQSQHVLRETWPVIPHHLLYPQSPPSLKPPPGNYPLVPGSE